MVSIAATEGGGGKYSGGKGNTIARVPKYVGVGGGKGLRPGRGSVRPHKKKTGKKEAQTSNTGGAPDLVVVPGRRAGPIKKGDGAWNGSEKQ